MPKYGPDGGGTAPAPSRGSPRRRLGAVDRCGCGDDFTSIFDEATAEHDRARYRANGPDRTTRMLLDMIGTRGVGGASVLDIGGGIGVIVPGLLRAGAGHAVLGDAASAYLQ